MIEKKVKLINDQQHIWDWVRRKYVLLQPEEEVRQRIIRFLHNIKKYPLTLMQVESGLQYNQMNLRSDILIFDSNSRPRLLVECKAPTVKIGQSVFDQAAKYNLTYKLDYLIVSNGTQTFCCKVNQADGSTEMQQEIPAFAEL